MKRPIAIRATTILLGLVALLQISVAGLLLIDWSAANRPGVADYGLGFVLTVGALWTFATALGIGRLRVWALRSVQVVATLLALVSAYGAATDIAALVRSGWPPDDFYAALSFGYMALLGLALWWLLFFNRRSTRALFERQAPSAAL